MSVLHDWYPGDRFVEFVLIVALGVTFLSTSAWVVASWLSRRAAARHLVLISALFGCLAMPVLAAAFSASGLTLIAIPLLPAGANGPDSSTGPRRWLPTPAPGSPVGDRVTRGAKVLPAFVSPARSEGESPRSARRGPAAAFPDAPRRVSPSAASPVRSDLPPAGESYRLRTIATLVLVVWACGSGFLLLRFAWSCRLVGRLRRSSVPLRDAAVLRLRDEAGRALGVRRLPQVLVVRDAPGPLAIGCRRPIILLPERLIGAVSDDELRDVLLHETAHLHRGDPLTVLLQELARALYWPIVPVHALIRVLRRAREELCDNHVLQGRDALSYGETLLHLAELSREAAPLVAGLGMLQWRGELERRIASLLDQRRSTVTRNNRWLVGLVGLLIAACGTLASSTRLSAGGPQTKQRAPNALKPEAAKPAPRADANSTEKPRRTLRVHILGPDGHPMAGVKIHRGIWTRKPFKDTQRNYVSDDSGQVLMELPQGMYIFRLWARIQSHVPLFAHWEEADDPETSLPAEFTFRLTRGTVIGGVVRDSAGQPIKGVIVEVSLEPGRREKARTSPDMWLAEGEPGGQRESTALITDEEGRWTLDNVPPAADLALRLKLSHPDYVSDPYWGTMQDEQGIELKDLRARTATITMRGGIVATGTVHDADGKPVAGAVVVRGDRPYWEVGSQEVRTDEQGRYRLPPLPAGKVTLTAIAQGWMPALTKVDIRQGMDPVDFHLRRGKELRLRLVDLAGKPVPGVDVQIKKWRGGESLYNYRHPNVLDTHIPVQADDTGFYHWTWAPDDAVTYQFWKEGHVRHETDLTASGSDQTVTLPQIVRISGKVTDREGRSIKGVTAIPVLEFRPGHLIVERNRAKGPFDGSYAIEGDRTDVAYRVRIEAPGYRAALSGTARAGNDAASPVFDLRLELAPPILGRLVVAGAPVKDARMYLATSSQNLNDWPAERSLGSVNQKVLTDDQGRFSFPAHYERYAVVAVHDRGYAEVHRQPDEQPGELALRAWARVEGRLVSAGRPIPSAWIAFAPVRILNEVLPHIQDDFQVKTDRDGRFVFPRVPPVKGHVWAPISVWGEWPIRSSQSIPLDLQPGETARVELGGKGTLVTGRVMLSGDAAAKIDLHKSLNWLLRRAPGIELPPEVRAPGLSARDGWNNAWMSTHEGRALINTFHNYFVMLDPDGRFQISGVPAGDYDLALRLYEPPGDGCLVSPVGGRVIRVQVTEEAARQATFDLGEIPVTVALGPRLGDLAPDFTAPTLSGGTVTLSSLRGRYVLLDFWATWCGPCIAGFPELSRLHQTIAANERVMVLGMNLDDDQAEARRFLESRELPWTQVSLGGRADAQADVLSRYGISSIPAYMLIEPTGKLIYRGDNLEEMAKVLRGELD